ncbi:hypothetical protein, partial [Neisseria musculi]|uniref:hypothetical protein n=1 Tax=Neisseria musculi TaxID=1815583 RepID=UPI00360B2C17
AISATGKSKPDLPPPAGGLLLLPLLLCLRSFTGADYMPQLKYRPSENRLSDGLYFILERD